MEVCTLILSAVITLQSCMEPERCSIYPEANVKVCIPGGVIACSSPEPSYECRSPDGTVRIKRRSDLNLPKG